MKTYFRRLQTAVDAGDGQTAGSEHQRLALTIDRAVKRGALHANNGARKKSRAAQLRRSSSPPPPRAWAIRHVEWVEFVRVESVPLPGDIVTAQEMWEEAGGGGAVSAAQLLKLAGDCTFFTALGDDELGHVAYDEGEGAALRLERNTASTAVPAAGVVGDGGPARRRSAPGRRGSRGQPQQLGRGHRTAAAGLLPHLPRGDDVAGSGTLSTRTNSTDPDVADHCYAHCGVRAARSFARSCAARVFLRAPVLRCSAPRLTARSIRETSSRCSVSARSASPASTAASRRRK